MPQSTIRGLGEIALRVSDLDRMQKFYEEIIGLELLRRFENAGAGTHAGLIFWFYTTRPEDVIAEITNKWNERGRP